MAGRVARVGSGVYNASKWAVNAFSESLRQEVTRQHVRVSLIEPGAVATELMAHNTDPEVLETMRQRFGSIEVLHPRTSPRPSPSSSPSPGGWRSTRC